VYGGSGFHGIPKVKRFQERERDGLRNLDLLYSGMSGYTIYLGSRIARHGESYLG
jgi:hypothetical protein